LYNWKRNSRGYNPNEEAPTVGHICRMPDDRLLKTLLFGMVEGERRPGLPARR